MSRRDALTDLSSAEAALSEARNMETWHLTEKQCCAKALECEPDCADAWRNLGSLDGGEVNGHAHTKKQRYEKALAQQPDLRRSGTTLVFWTAAM